MKSESLWPIESTYFLKQIDLFNWGGFHGRHTAHIDLAGTAIIGPTGSGKTTLVDAFMTLLCAKPRYNLASTGGHESDRDLVSYVRGVSGPGDGGAGQSHISRPGKTLTALCATLECSEQVVHMGVVLWFEGSSSSASDLKKLWLFSTSPEQGLETWLSTHQQGGMRALRQMEKNTTGIWSFPSNKAYLARLRDHFDVGENAFTLLNRAAGLKQLNSIDEIFRELVLDDHAAFDRAAEVANSFDDLTDIHEELVIAKRQQKSLIPVQETWEKHQQQTAELQTKEKVKAVLPVWFAEQAARLWQSQVQALSQQLQNATEAHTQAKQGISKQKVKVETCWQRYMEAGGSNLEHLQNHLADSKKIRDQIHTMALQYQQQMQRLQLPADLSEGVFSDNQNKVQDLIKQTQQALTTTEQHVYEKGLSAHESDCLLKNLQQDLKAVLSRPDSNIPPAFQAFRQDLAEHLDIQEQDLPFVAELVQVKTSEQDWRGAIERAIGSHRLRLLIAPDYARQALKWINQRHNRLHVRLLQVKAPAKPAVFMNDGFTRKLDFKKHPFIDTLKSLLADIDRHCVDTVETLESTPHAITQAGLMSGKARFFDKQDQKRLSDDWLTGFSNKDRLQQLKTQIVAAEQTAHKTQTDLAQVKSLQQDKAAQLVILHSLSNMQFDQIDLPNVEQKCESLAQQLAALNDPSSDIAEWKRKLDLEKQSLTELEEAHQQTLHQKAELTAQLKHATLTQTQVQRRAEKGLTDDQRALVSEQMPTLSDDALTSLNDIERQHSTDLQNNIDLSQKKLADLAQQLTKRMSDAKNEDRGALAEVGRELEDVPTYLARLHVLTEEALPEKLNRFLSYLNRSSDEGVTQLLSHIDNEVAMIEERIEDLNHTLLRVDFQPQKYLRLISNKIVHESLRSLQKAQRQLNSARLQDDEGESHYKALRHLVSLLRDACERNRTQGAKALLDPRYRLAFAVSVIDRESGKVIETRTGSQGGSGGEKEIIASYVLTASLSYALCPDGRASPLFGTIVLDEAFSRSSQAVAGRIIAALKEFGLHAVFITPNKEMRLLRKHTRSAIVVHRRELQSSLTSLSWEALDDLHQQHKQNLANKNENAD